MRNLDANLLNVTRESFRQRPAANESGGRELAQVGESKIFEHRLLQHQPLRLAVFCQQTDAGANGVPRAANVVSFSINLNRASASFISTKYQARGFGAARSH